MLDGRVVKATPKWAPLGAATTAATTPWKGSFEKFRISVYNRKFQQRAKFAFRTKGNILIKFNSIKLELDYYLKKASDSEI